MNPEVYNAIEHKLTELLVLARDLNVELNPDTRILRDSIISFCPCATLVCHRAKRSTTGMLPFGEN